MNLGSLNQLYRPKHIYAQSLVEIYDRERILVNLEGARPNTIHIISRSCTSSISGHNNVTNGLQTGIIAILDISCAVSLMPDRNPDMPV